MERLETFTLFAENLKSQMEEYESRIANGCNLCPDEIDEFLQIYGRYAIIRSIIDDCPGRRRRYVEDLPQ